MRALIGASALLALVAGPGAAQVVRIDEVRPLRPDAVVEIEVVEHSLVVEAWDRDEIRIVGTYDAALEEMEITGTESRLRFEIDREGGRRGRREGSERLEVRLPRGVRLSLETVSGAIEVGGLTGALDAEAVSGSVEVAGDLASAELGSVSGSVRYTGDAPIVSLESVSGSGAYVGTARDVRLETVSGSLRMEGGAETIEAETVSGSIRITSSTPVRFLDASSVSGQVRFSGALAPSGRIEAESHSGTVELALGSGADAEFELGTFSGSVSASLPGMRNEVREGSRFTREESLTFLTGSGLGRVRAQSFSGTVRIVER